MGTIPKKFQQLIDITLTKSLTLAPVVFEQSGFHVPMLTVIKPDGVHFIMLDFTNETTKTTSVFQAKEFCENAYAVIFISERDEREIVVENLKIRQEIQRTGKVPESVLAKTPIIQTLSVQIERLDQSQIHRIAWRIYRNEAGKSTVVPYSDNKFTANNDSMAVFMKHDWD
jgi:hypothetical protein